MLKLETSNRMLASQKQYFSRPGRDQNLRRRPISHLQQTLGPQIFEERKGFFLTHVAVHIISRCEVLDEIRDFFGAINRLPNLERDIRNGIVETIGDADHYD